MTPAILNARGYVQAISGQYAAKLIACAAFGHAWARTGYYGSDLWQHCTRCGDNRRCHFMLPWHAIR